MPGEVSRITGEITVMPDFSPAQRQQLAETIARAMVQMARPEIEQALQKMRKAGG